MALFEAYKPKVEALESALWLLETGLSILPTTARLLMNRGIVVQAEANAFLNPALSQLHDPFLLSGMEAAVSRIKQAASDREKVLIYGDYDVDGITSASILYLYFKKIGLIPQVYIPSRHEDGYGVHEPGIRAFADEGGRLMITVDCGITAVDEMLFAKQRGMDVIITDHHTPGLIMPACLAIIHPRLQGQDYPFPDLAGVGVAAKLIQALGGVEALSEYLDLISIGTIADIVPLLGENRVFAAQGIKQMATKLRPGIKALLQASGIQDKTLDAGTISYRLAPCLNAPGRLSTYHKGFELLTAEDMDKAQEPANILVSQNIQRREIERSILKEACQVVEQQSDLSKDRFLILAGKGWHPGVIGIVASKITELYHRPTVILSIEGEECVGSARNIPNFNIYTALSTCSDLFSRFGGHAQAAGLSIPLQNLDAFRKRMNDFAQQHITEAMLIPRMFYDSALTAEDIVPGLVGEIERMAPFGAGNPAPSFLIASASVDSSRPVGRDAQHVKMTLTLGVRSWDAIGFNLGNVDGDLTQGCRIRFLASLARNEWMGISKTQFQLKGLKRLYQNDKDVTELLQDFYFKFFNVFFDEFMYNKNGMMEKKPVWVKKLEPIDLSGVYNILEHTSVGHLFLIHTAESAKVVVRDLIKHALLSNVSLRYHQPNQMEGIGRNVLLLAPDVQNIPIHHYHTLLVPKAEIPLLKSVSLPKTTHNLRILAVDEKELGLPISVLFKVLAVDRTLMAGVYRWIRAIIPGRDYWPDPIRLLDACNTGTGLDLNGFQLQLALEVFKELGFLHISSENRGIRIQGIKSPKNRSLEDSEIYKYHRAWLSCREEQSKEMQA